jgi:hypothetical protein
MPTKTKKPPTKTTSKAKTSKKSPSRLDRVIKKLNLARPRNQFIVAFLVVGLLGGGYFAYQSFAATSYVWRPPAIGGANYTENSGNKANSEVIAFSTRSGARTSVAKYIGEGGFYQVCLATRSAQVGSSIRVKVFNASNMVTMFDTNIGSTMSPTRDYSRRCSNTNVYIPAGGSVKIQVGPSSLNTVYVSYAFIEKVTTNQPSSK